MKAPGDCEKPRHGRGAPGKQSTCYCLFSLRLRLAFPRSLVDLTPFVFLLPLLLVNTAVFDETFSLFVFAGTLALVSTTPVRGGFPALLLVFAPFVLDSVDPQLARESAPPTTKASAKVRCIDFVPPMFLLLAVNSLSGKSLRRDSSSNLAQNSPRLRDFGVLRPLECRLS